MNQKIVREIPFRVFINMVDTADVTKLNGQFVDKHKVDGNHLSIITDGDETMFSESSGYTLTVQSGATFVTTNRGNIITFYKLHAMNMTNDLFY